MGGILKYRATESDPWTIVGTSGVTMSNQNLLDNWYFADPIDQRGGYVVKPGFPYYQVTEGYPYVGETDKYYTATIDDVGNLHFFINGVEYFLNAAINPDGYVRGYTGAGAYSIDRWYRGYENAALTIHDGYISIHGAANAEFMQRIEPLLLGQTVTASVLLADNTIAYATGKLPDMYDGGYLPTGIIVSLPNTNGAVLDISYYDGRLRFNFVCPAGSTVNLVAAKLELGTTQTLAHQDENGNWVLNDPPPNKALELMKCQRYYWQENVAQYSSLLHGFASSTTKLICPVKYPVQMRAQPVVSVGTDVYVNGKATLFPSGASYQVYWHTNGGCHVEFTFTGISLTAGDGYFINSNGPDKHYICVSADL